LLSRDQPSFNIYFFYFSNFKNFNYQNTNLLFTFFGIPYLLLRSTREKIEHERKIKFNIQNTLFQEGFFKFHGRRKSHRPGPYIYFSAIYLSVLLGNRTEVSLAPLREYIADHFGTVQRSETLKGVNFREAIKKTIQGLNSISKE
jgi:hypothetical protein